MARFPKCKFKNTHTQQQKQHKCNHLLLQNYAEQGRSSANIAERLPSDTRMKLTHEESILKSLVMTSAFLHLTPANCAIVEVAFHHVSVLLSLSRWVLIPSIVSLGERCCRNRLQMTTCRLAKVTRLPSQRALV